MEAGVIAPSDRVGLLHGGLTVVGMDLSTADAIAHTFDFHLTSGVTVPPSFGDNALLAGEAAMGLLQTDYSESDRMAAKEALPLEQVLVLEHIERFYISTATQFRDAGVTTVVSTSAWQDLRRLIRAAERVGWHPKWVTNEIHISSALLSDVPEAQKANVVQVSSRRAAGDEVTEAEKGCEALRNIGSTAGTFSHQSQRRLEQPCVRLRLPRRGVRPQ